MPKTKYTQNLLEELSIRDKCILIGEYSSTNCTSNIQFTCKCGKSYNKTFICATRTGLFCDKCARIYTLSKTYSKYTKELLDTLLKRDYAILIGDYAIFTAYTPIKFKCRCGTEYTKKYRYIIEYDGLHCYNCTKNNTSVKMEETTFKRFGVKYASHAQSIKDKVVKTNIERYGVAYTLQDKTIREKGKATMLANLGVENPSQSNIIKEKRKLHSWNIMALIIISKVQK